MDTYIVDLPLTFNIPLEMPQLPKEMRKAFAPLVAFQYSIGDASLRVWPSWPGTPGTFNTPLEMLRTRSPTGRRGCIHISFNTQLEMPEFDSIRRQGYDIVFQYSIGDARLAVPLHSACGQPRDLSILHWRYRCFGPCPPKNPPEAFNTLLEMQ